ncbi:MAG: hypothetical protein N2C14_22305 [Planctomycetales bacterium]
MSEPPNLGETGVETFPRVYGVPSVSPTANPVNPLVGLSSHDHVLG